jgi:hypothetical protein
MVEVEEDEDHPMPPAPLTAPPLFIDWPLLPRLPQLTPPSDTLRPQQPRPPASRQRPVKAIAALPPPPAPPPARDAAVGPGPRWPTMLARLRSDNRPWHLRAFEGQ